MLSIRLPASLEAQFLAHCQSLGMTKTQGVHDAITRMLHAKQSLPIGSQDPLAKWIGVAQTGASADQHLRTTRGKGWNQT